MARSDFQVVVCGGGIAGVEGLLRLHRLTAGQVGLTLIEPQDALVYRPLAVREPFALPGARHYPLEQIASDTDARWEQDRLAWVDPDARRIHTDGGLELTYDALLVAVGARESAPFEHAHVFTDRNADETFHGIVQDIELGYVNSIAFVLPRGPAWPLPLYELALMTAERARSMDVSPRLTFITPEGRPLKAFGQAAGDAILRLFEAAGIDLHPGVIARLPAPRQVVLDGTALEADWVVTLPQITGPAIRGLPAGVDWFLPVDDRCLVPSTDGRVFAAGDVTELPVKHGGLGAQQADTAAGEIAHLAGVGDRPPPLHPVIRGMLLTGRRPVYLSAYVNAGLGWQSEIHEEPPWPAGGKVVAEELGAYLSRMDPAVAP